MGGSAVIEGVDDGADMVETQKTFALLGERERGPAQGGEEGKARGDPEVSFQDGHAARV